MVNWSENTIEFGLLTITLYVHVSYSNANLNMVQVGSQINMYQGYLSEDYANTKWDSVKFHINSIVKEETP